MMKIVYQPEMGSDDNRFIPIHPKEIKALNDDNPIIAIVLEILRNATDKIKKLQQNDFVCTVKYQFFAPSLAQIANNSVVDQTIKYPPIFVGIVLFKLFFLYQNEKIYIHDLRTNPPTYEEYKNSATIIDISDPKSIDKLSNFVIANCSI